MTAKYILLACLALGLSGAAHSPAAAQAVNTKELSNATQDKKPVDIEADQMEVLQDQKSAIFTGKVDAKRGDVKLASDRLVATYSEEPRQDGSKKTDVTFLDASGNVVIITTTQRITGETMHMDVKTNQVTVKGNVVVTQGSTVLKGNELFADLDKNTSRLSGGRVKGSFVPRQQEDKAKKKP
jgi:lipopolysaccharide export system protein LptA